MSARILTALNEVTLGCSVWSAERRHDDDLPVGGVVVAMESVPDAETGEVCKFFKTMDPYRRKGAVHSVRESEIDLGSIEGLDYSRVNRLIRRMAEDVAKGKGTLLPEHGQLVDWMHALLRGVAA